MERRAYQFAHALGLIAHAQLDWSWSDITVESGNGDCDICRSTARPDGLALNRVPAVDRIVDDLDDGSLTLADAWDRLRSAVALPVANTVVFTGACVVGGCGLGVLFGVRHAATVALIAAGCGRRGRPSDTRTRGR